MERLSGYAVVLGASSGFGASIARTLAREGMNVLGVHLDRRATLAQAEGVTADVRAAGRSAVFFNVNAADAAKRDEVLDQFALMLGEGRRGAVRVLVHSLAFGALRPLVGPEAATQAQLEMTFDVMAHSLVHWTRGLVERELLAEGGRVFALTSSGSTRTLPHYGPVGAAKAALEAYVRQLAFELAPRGIAVNALRAGITDTPAARRIPGSEAMLAAQRARHPAGRLTTPEDVAELVALLSRPGARWLTGDVLGVDGGEDNLA
jgi:NAD(P)-dependent dehydrogenase (short-subunit alcohol dehydrogenase family)